MFRLGFSSRRGNRFCSMWVWKGQFSAANISHGRILGPKNWCFWTVVLEKTLESPLDCKEIQLVHPKGNQSWMFIGRTDVEAETPILWPPDAKSWLIWKDPDDGKDWREEERGWGGWMASLTHDSHGSVCTLLLCLPCGWAHRFWNVGQGKEQYGWLSTAVFCAGKCLGSGIIRLFE